MNKSQILFGKVIVKGHVFPITGPYCLFGSAAGCDVRIKEKGIASTHCQIEFNSEKQAFLRCFNPVLLDGKQESGVIELGDVAHLTVGNKEFTFTKQVQRTQKRIKPDDEARRYVKGRSDPDDIYSKYINDFIGHGVFAKKPIRNGKFLCEYNGTLSKAEDVKDKDTCYTYFFQHNDIEYCIDANEKPEPYDPCLGRLVNHADTKQQRNSKMVILTVEGVPHLVLFATRDIHQDEEIRYNYGVKDLPWSEAKTANGVSLKQIGKKNQTKPRGEAIENCHNETDNNNVIFYARRVDGGAINYDMTNTEKRGETDMCVDNLPLSVSYDNQVEGNTLKTDSKDANISQAQNKQKIGETDMCVGNVARSMSNGKQVEGDNLKNDPKDADISKLKNEQKTGETDTCDDCELSMSYSTNSEVEGDTLRNDSKDADISKFQTEQKISETDVCVDAVPLSMSYDEQEERDTSKKNSKDSDISNPKSEQKIGGTDMCVGHVPLSMANDKQVDGETMRKDSKDADISKLQTEQNTVDDDSSSSSDHGETLYNIESDLDDSDADPDYVASSSDDSDNTVEVHTEILSKEQIEYVSDSDDSGVIQVQPINLAVLLNVPQAPISKTKDFSSQLPTGNETVQKATLVQTTTAYKDDGKRNVDKKHCCVFCGKYYLRIGRHLQTHEEKEEIKRLPNLNDKERTKMLDKLRLDGDFTHNLKVRESGVGNLILPRRPSDKDAGRYSFHDYKPCEICKGFYLRWELWRHMPKCPLATKDQLRRIKEPSRTMWQQRSTLMMEAAMPSTKQYIYNEMFTQKIVGSMKTDEISLVVRNDSIIMKIGEEMFEEKGLQQKTSITQKMRLLGRLVLKMREITFHESSYLDFFLKSNMFDFFIEAAKDLSGIYDGKMAPSYKTPSVAIKLGPALKECCAIARGRHNRSGDDISLSSLQRLQMLIDDEWDKRVQSIARRSRQEYRRNKQVLLPKASDLGILNKYIEDELAVAEIALKNETSNANFQRLSSLVLTKLIVFNRRRSGEASKIFLDDYMQKPDWHGNLNEVIMRQLSVLERQLVKRLDLIMIRGKRDRNVAAILIPEVKRALNLLVDCRDRVGINKENMYLFPRSTGTDHIEGHVSLRNLTAEILELEYPERICSTSIRKFTATIVQMLNLNSGEIEWLSNHLGHTVDVHKEYYRNHESAVEMGKIASMLLRLDRSTNIENASDSESDCEDNIIDVLNEQIGHKTSKYVPMDGDNSSSASIFPSTDKGIPISVHQSCTDHDSPIEPSVSVAKTIKYPPKQKAETTVKSKSLKKKKIVPWSEEQKQALRRAFAKNLRMLNVPNKEECESARQREPSLFDREWKNIKFRVHHEIQRLKKK